MAEEQLAPSPFVVKLKRKLKDLLGESAQSKQAKIIDLLQGKFTEEGLQSALIDILGEQDAKDLADWLVAEHNRELELEASESAQEGRSSDRSQTRRSRRRSHEQTPITSRIGPPLNEEQRQLDEEEEETELWNDREKRQKTDPSEVPPWTFDPYYGSPYAAPMYMEGGLYPPGGYPSHYSFYGGRGAGQHPRPRPAFQNRTWVRSENEGQGVEPIEKSLETSRPQPRPHRPLLQTKNRSWVNPSLQAKAEEALSESLPVTPPPEE